MPNTVFDAHELAAFTKDLEKSAAIMPAAAGAVVTKAALNIKNDARQRISGRPHIPAYPYSITFDDVRVNRLGASTEVGPDKSKRQGALGNILEYGSPGHPPIPHLGPAAEAEEPKFAKAIDELAGKALGR